ncbi:hypothetical protein [Adhaeribacter radiodurans]|uniref:Uncharacterized protein n=1 Tax=Adhaeribacter radiodurans TaxID=2745197 RepID=A0A7L7LF21_9BACT|nr:hypothetical protein [Adhaeribacter radiodurans]QMU31284.1 hypothetical protein HUW48_26090 [Adhaeribacter radiodurans]
MDFTFTKLSWKNALLSLIPFVPICTGIFAAFLQDSLSNHLGNCEAGVLITIRVLFFLILITASVIFYKVHQWHVALPNLYFKNRYRIFSFIIYTFLNGFIFFVKIGPETSCRSDGQTGLYFYISGFFASVFILVLGFLIDGCRYIFFEKD